MDSTSRIMAENAAILKLKKSVGGELSATIAPKINLSKIYYICLWSQISFGVILFLLNIYEPKNLIVLGALINAVAMLVHVILVTILNRRSLAPIFQPGRVRRLILYFIIIFFIFFSAVVIRDIF
jgi:hypothetical protein